MQRRKPQKNLLRPELIREVDGARVEANELRGGAALVLAGLCAQGETIIEGYSYIRRGYEDICRDITMLGGKISIQEMEFGEWETNLNEGK